MKKCSRLESSFWENREFLLPSRDIASLLVTLFAHVCALYTDWRAQTATSVNQSSQCSQRILVQGQLQDVLYSHMGQYLSQLSWYHRLSNIPGYPASIQEPSQLIVIFPTSFIRSKNVGTGLFPYVFTFALGDMPSFVVIMAPWTWPSLALQFVDSGADVTQPRSEALRKCAHGEFTMTHHGVQGCRNISMPQRAHLSLVILSDSKEWPCVWWIWKLPQTPAHVVSAGPQWPPCRPMSRAGSSWCGGFTAKGDAEGISDFRLLHPWWVLRVSCVVLCYVVLFLKQSGLTEMEAGFPMTHDKSWKCGLVLLCKNLSCLDFFGCW